MELTFPKVSLDLIRHLDSIFPDKSPALADQQREVWAMAGARKVIDRLISEYQSQNNVTLERRGVLDPTPTGKGGPLSGSASPSSGPNGPGANSTRSWQGSR